MSAQEKLAFLGGSPVRRRPYNPLRSTELALDAETVSKVDPQNYDLPNSVQAFRNHFRIPHQVLLGDRDDIAAAVAKIRRNVAALKSFS